MSRSRRILFINQHYAPDVAATGQYLTDLAEHLASSGHEVHVLCGSAGYGSADSDAPAKETREGVFVRRLRTTSFGRGTHLGRVIDYVSFFGQVFLRFLSGARFDTVVVLTTPPLLSVAAAAGRIVRRQRYGIWSMDLHPEAEEAHGMLKPGGIASRVLHGLSGYGYRHADFIVSVGRCMSDRLAARGLPEGMVTTIPLGSAADKVVPLEKAENPLAKELGLVDRFVVMYSGNAGVAHQFEELLGAADHFRDHPEIYFLFVGGGPRKQEVVDFIQGNALQNAAYLDYFPRDQIRHSLPLADVHVITLRPEMCGIAVPSKLFGAMATARPIVMVGPRSSEVARIIEESECGFVIDPETETDPTGQFIRILQRLQEDPGYARNLGRAGREAFVSNYAEDRAFARWTALLASSSDLPESTHQSGSTKENTTELSVEV